MWTRKDIKEFKEAIKKEGSEGIVKVGHGETVTVSFRADVYVLKSETKLLAGSSANP